jgi:hypothetical protein
MRSQAIQPHFERYCLSNGIFWTAHTYARELMVQVLSDLSEQRREVLLPKYICNSVVDAVIAAKAQPVFYPVDPSSGFSEQGASIRQKISPHTGAVLFVDYFGVRYKISRDLRDFLRTNKIAIISDASHAYLSLVLQKFSGVGDVDFTFTSLYKSVPTQVGAILFSKTKKLPNSISPREFFRVFFRSFLIQMAITLWNPLIDRNMTILRTAKVHISIKYSRTKKLFSFLFLRFLWFIDEETLINKRMACAIEIFDTVERYGSLTAKNVYTREQVLFSVFSLYPLLFPNSRLRDLMCRRMHHKGIDVQTWPVFSEVNKDDSNWDRILLIPVARKVAWEVEMVLREFLSTSIESESYVSVVM